MAAGFLEIDAEARDHGIANSQNTTITFTPTVGDVVFFATWGIGAAPADPTVTNGTWVKRHGRTATTSGSSWVWAFECTAGGSEGVLTIANAANWSDTNYAIVRPTDLKFASVAGSGVAASTSVTVALTTTSPAGLLCYGTGTDQRTFTPDTDWTELLDENIANGHSHQVQYRLSDDSECIVTINGSAQVAGIVLEYDAAAAPSSTVGTPGRAMSRAFSRAFSRGMARSMEKINGLWRPTGPLVVPVGISLAGAR